MLEEAAAWLVRMDNQTLGVEELQALDRWCNTSPEHTRIWMTACELNRHFSRLPNHLARPVLTRERLSRRTLLKSLAGAGVLIPLGISGALNQPWKPLLAMHRTQVGERRSITLEDGSKLLLNTDTALDVHYDGHQRLVQLYKGEVLARSAAGQRPFAITSPAGTAITLNTDSSVFALRCFGQTSVLTVKRPSIKVIPAAIEPGYSATESFVHSRQQCRFNANNIEWIAEAPKGSLAWRRGELIVERWPLEQVLAELARYRPGILRCDSEVADIRVSGVFQTGKTDQALDVLAALFKLQITRITPYWVSLGTAT